VSIEPFFCKSHTATQNLGSFFGRSRHRTRHMCNSTGRMLYIHYTDWQPATPTNISGDGYTTRRRIYRVGWIKRQMYARDNGQNGCLGRTKTASVNGHTVAVPWVTSRVDEHPQRRPRRDTRCFYFRSLGPRRVLRTTRFFMRVSR